MHTKSLVGRFVSIPICLSKMPNTDVLVHDNPSASNESSEVHGVSEPPRLVVDLLAQ